MAAWRRRRLKPGLTWHDGTPLTADDVAFTRRVNIARFEWGLDQGIAEYREMDEITAPDPGRSSSAGASRSRRPPPPSSSPYPRHILEGPLDQGSADAFDSHPYWSNGWVGAGPYKVHRWERGSFIEGVAFDGYALGSPKIKRVRLSWNNDPNVTLTRLLAGDGDIALDGSMRFQQATVLRERWNSASDGTILLNPTSLRYMQYQSRTEYVNPRFMHDVRVRRALMHALDRAGLAETMLEDQSMAADTIPPRTSPSYPQIERVITKYPYDPRRADQLLGEVGFAKAGDGVYASPGSDGSGSKCGASPVVPRSRTRRSSPTPFPELRAGHDDPAPSVIAPRIGRYGQGHLPGTDPEQQYVAARPGARKMAQRQHRPPGQQLDLRNRTGFTDPEYNRLHELWSTTLDRTQANGYLADMMRLLSESVGLFPLYYNFQVVAHTATLRGPQPMTPDSSRYGNIHEWEWR